MDDIMDINPFIIILYNVFSIIYYNKEYNLIISGKLIHIQY